MEKGTLRSCRPLCLRLPARIFLFLAGRQHGTGQTVWPRLDDSPFLSILTAYHSLFPSHHAFVRRQLGKSAFGGKPFSKRLSVLIPAASTTSAAGQQEVPEDETPGACRPGRFVPVSFVQPYKPICKPRTPPLLSRGMPVGKRRAKPAWVPWTVQASTGGGLLKSGRALLTQKTLVSLWKALPAPALCQKQRQNNTGQI